MKRAHRTVSVILEADVDGTGFTGELLTVKPGFARNYLLPKRLAVVATPKLAGEREKQIAAATAKREQEIAARQELADQLGAESVKLSLKVGAAGQVFGSLTASDVAGAIKDQRKLTVDPKQLSGLPTKRLGDQTVSAKLGLGVSALIHLDVEPERAADEDDASPTRK